MAEVRRNLNPKRAQRNSLRENRSKSKKVNRDRDNSTAHLLLLSLIPAVSIHIHTIIMSSDNHRAYVAIPMNLFSSDNDDVPDSHSRRGRYRNLLSRNGYLIPKIAAIVVGLCLLILLPLWIRAHHHSRHSMFRPPPEFITDASPNKHDSTPFGEIDDMIVTEIMEEPVDIFDDDSIYDEVDIDSYYMDDDDEVWVAEEENDVFYTEEESAVDEPLAFYSDVTAETTMKNDTEEEGN